MASRHKNFNDIDVPDDFTLPEGNPARGRLLFKKHCAQCHTIRKDGRNPHGSCLGPSLYGVMGRTAAQDQRSGWVTRSTAFEESNILWTDRNMMAFLKNPRAFAGGVINMNFKGMDSWKDRIDVIHYLKYAGHESWMTLDGTPHSQKDWWKRGTGATTGYWDVNGRDDGKDIKPWQHLWRAAKRKTSDFSGGVKDAVSSGLGIDLSASSTDESWDVKPDSATTSRYDPALNTYYRPVEHVPDGVKVATKKQSFNWPPHEVIAQGPTRNSPPASPSAQEFANDPVAISPASPNSSRDIAAEPAVEPYLQGGYRAASGLVVYRDDGKPPGPPRESQQPASRALKVTRGKGQVAAGAQSAAKASDLSANMKSDGAIESPGGLLVYDAL